MCQQAGCCWLLAKELHTRGQDVEAGGVVVGLEEGEAGGCQGWQQGLCCVSDASQTAVVHLNRRQ